jgi:hypothetical protein
MCTPVEAAQIEHALCGWACRLCAAVQMEDVLSAMSQVCA